MPEFSDEQLTQLLRATQAAPGDAAWAKALAHMRSEDSAPPWLAWAMRPVALATAAGMLMCAVGVSVWWIGSRSDSNALAQQVLAAGGASESADLGVTLNPTATRDSGTLQ
jgi:hypothetical protein